MKTSQMSEQLNRALKSGDLKVKKTMKKPQKTTGYKLRSLREIGADGVGHINTTNRGATELGRFLSTQRKSHFKHNLCGPFTTMEGFMWYVCTEDDQLRNLSGHAAAVVGRKLTAQDKRATTHAFFIAASADAYWQYVNSSEKAIALMKESTLPFDMYNVNAETNFPLRVGKAAWLCAALELIREALKKGYVYPMFDQLFEPAGPFGRKEVTKYSIEHQMDKNNRPAAIKAYFEEKIKEHFAGILMQPEAKSVEDKKADAAEAAKQIVADTDAEVSTPGATVAANAATSEAVTQAVNEVLSGSGDSGTPDDTTDVCDTPGDQA